MSDLRELAAKWRGMAKWNRQQKPSWKAKKFDQEITSDAYLEGIAARWEQAADELSAALGAAVGEGQAEPSDLEAAVGYFLQRFSVHYGVMREGSEMGEAFLRVVEALKRAAAQPRADVERDALEKADALADAAEKVNHWHDHVYPDGAEGMVVSKGAVLGLWDALAAYRKARHAAEQLRKGRG